MGSHMAAVIGAFVIGLMLIFVIVIGQGIAGGQSTVGWPTILVTIMNNVMPIVGVVGIIAMFLIVVKLSGGFGVS